MFVLPRKIIKMLKSQLQGVTKIITHANCPDGIVSGMILKDALDLRPDQVVFINPESKDIQPEPGLLFCDCSPNEKITEFIKAGALVLDHHKSNKDIVNSFGKNGVFADLEKRPGVSGARLAYEEVWLTMRTGVSRKYKEFVDELSKITGVRDTWQQNNPLWGKSCEQAAILTFFPTDLWISNSLYNIAVNWEVKYSWLGKLLINRVNEKANNFADKSWVYKTKNGLIISIIDSKSVSDVADILKGKCGLVIGFGYSKSEDGKYPKLSLSLRSYGNSFDCSNFCKKYGGGGHTNSAGCSFETDELTPNPYRFISDKVEKYFNEKI